MSKRFNLAIWWGKNLNSSIHWTVYYVKENHLNFPPSLLVNAGVHPRTVWSESCLKELQQTAKVCAFRLLRFSKQNLFSAFYQSVPGVIFHSEDRTCTTTSKLFNISIVLDLNCKMGYHHHKEDLKTPNLNHLTYTKVWSINTNSFLFFPF